jgi:hypothetical protein
MHTLVTVFKLYPSRFGLELVARPANSEPDLRLSR